MADDPRDLVRWMRHDGTLGAVRTVLRPGETPAATATDRITQAVAAGPLAPAPARPARPWQRPAFGAVLILAAALNLYGLNSAGYDNQYYAAAVFSMLQSWHNAFFASFDPAGFVSVDKPPLGFMIQAAFARVLGFSGFSLLLPEALAGIASVAMLYLLVRRAFGPGVGLLAALVLALTPVSVAVSRNNTIDSLLVLALLLAAWAASRAAERGSLRWLLAAAAVVGLGFAIKMLQAYLVVPAIFLLYLAAAPRPRLTRAGHLALAGMVLLVVSFAWPVAVDLTPAGARPWVDSTQDNSAMSLALGYNGLERLLGRNSALGQTLEAALGGADASPDGPVGFGGGPGGMGENGPPGPLRLVNQQLGGQAGWLVPLALCGLAASAMLAWRRRRTLHRSRRAQACFLWGTWAVTAGAFFSVAGYFHSYYLVMLGPPLAALAAIGVWGCWRAYRRRRRLAWLLPLALLATAAVQAHLLANYQAWSAWLTPVALGGAAVAAAVLLALRLGIRTLPRRSRLTTGAHLAVGLGCLALLVAPAVWSGYSAFSGAGGGGIPVAGPRGFGMGGFGPGGFQPRGVPPDFAGTPPDFAGRRGADGRAARTDGDGARAARGAADDGRPGGFGPGEQFSAGLVAYLEANQGGATFLVATPNSNSAAPLILATGKPVMSLGGFLGSDPILDADRLARMVSAGEVRFFLLGGGPGGPDEAGWGNWVQEQCAPVSAAAIAAASGQPATNAGWFRAEQLYDCAGAGGASA